MKYRKEYQGWVVEVGYNLQLQPVDYPPMVGYAWMEWRKGYQGWVDEEGYNLQLRPAAYPVVIEYYAKWKEYQDSDVEGDYNLRLPWVDYGIDDA